MHKIGSEGHIIGFQYLGCAITQENIPQTVQKQTQTHVIHHRKQLKSITKIPNIKDKIRQTLHLKMRTRNRKDNKSRTN